MSVSGELRAQRRVTSAFIAAQPISLTLNPVVLTKTASGGVVRGRTEPRDPQTLRLIDQSTAGGNNPGLLRAGDGAQRRVTHQLLGEYDSAMEVGDWWLGPGGARYEVVEMIPFNGYEKRGQVIRYG